MHRGEEGPGQRESGVGKPREGGGELHEPKDIVSAVPSFGWARGNTSRSVSSLCSQFTLWNPGSITQYT